MRALALLVLLLSGSACSAYTGGARDMAPDTLRRERGWLAVHGVPVLHQQAEHDCGPTALAMVVGYHRPDLTDSPLLDADRTHRTSARELRDRARKLGMRAFVVEGAPEDLLNELKQGRPAIVGMAKPTIQGAVSHYEVVIGIHKDSRRIATLDPAEGWRQNSLVDFMTEWESTGRVLLVVIPAAATTQPVAPSAQAALNDAAD